MKWLHKLFSFLGLSLGGANTCLKYECKEYCGYSPTEYIKFHSGKVKEIPKGPKLRERKWWEY